MNLSVPTRKALFPMKSLILLPNKRSLLLWVERKCSSENNLRFSLASIKLWINNFRFIWKQQIRMTFLQTQNAGGTGDLNRMSINIFDSKLDFLTKKTLTALGWLPFIQETLSERVLNFWSQTSVILTFIKIFKYLPQNFKTISFALLGQPQRKSRGKSIWSNSVYDKKKCFLKAQK